jgi:hypothetical protein
MSKSMMELTLKNTTKFSFELDERIAGAIAEHHVDGGVFFCIEGREKFSVDLKNVLAIQVLPLGTVTTVLAKDLNPVPRQGGIASQVPIQCNQRDNDADKTKELFKIECNCGAEYFATLFSDCTKCRCRECNERVYVDTYVLKRPEIMVDRQRWPRTSTGYRLLRISKVHK